MPKDREYRITATPCEVRDGYVQVKISLMIKPPELRVVAGSLGQVKDAARQFAKDHGRQCVVSIHCMTKPKPAGFDDAIKAEFGWGKVFNEGAV